MTSMDLQSRADHFQRLLNQIGQDNKRLHEIAAELAEIVARGKEFQDYYTSGQWQADVDAQVEPSAEAVGDGTFETSLYSEDAPWEQVTTMDASTRRIHQLTQPSGDSSSDD